MAYYIWICKKCRVKSEGTTTPPKDLTCDACKKSKKDK